MEHKGNVENPCILVEVGPPVPPYGGFATSQKYVQILHLPAVWRYGFMEAFFT
jgi:hypothetical protein